MLIDVAWLNDREVLYRNTKNGGLLVQIDDRLVAKIFPYKGWVLGWFRILTHRTKAHKQARSARRLLEIGLNTPEPLEVIAFFPKGGLYEGALVYEFVKDVSEARSIMLTPLREEFLSHLADELVVMARAGVLFVDLHLGNILVDEKGGLHWIDVEVKEGHGLVRAKFWSRVIRLRTKCDPEMIGEKEWRFLCERIKEGLPTDIAFQDEPEL